MDNTFDNGVLGMNYVPPSPLYPAGRPIDLGSAGVSPGAGASPAPSTGTSPSANIMPGALDFAQFVGASPQGGMFGPGTGRAMSSLGAGLSSAGQNWNKPALAAFAAGAGAALQGGQQFDNQAQDLKLKALHAAIAAFKAGDIAAYHRSLADYHKAVADQKQQHARPATPLPQPAQSQLPATPAAEPEEAAARSTPPAQDGAAPAEAAAGQPQVTVAHVRALDRLLTAAGVPPDRVQTSDLDSAARLMAAKAMPAAEAFETASMHNAMNAGHVSPAEIDFIYGPGAADAIRSAAAS